MENILTTEQATKKLQQEYPMGVDLYYVDYRDTLRDIPEAITQVMECWYYDCLLDNRYIWDWIDYIINNIFNEEEREYINENYELYQSIMDRIYDNDKSDPLKDLCKNTNDIRIRIPMYSNHDCINSISVADLRYPDSYLADVIDTLEINPREVYDLLTYMDSVASQEPRPDMQDRNPYISAKDMIAELWDNYWDWLRTFVWLLDISYCLWHGIWTKITIPKWNKWGFFATGVWSWSCIEAVLLRDITIDLTETIHPNLPQYKKRSVLNDNDKSNSYNMNDVYWPTEEFYTNEIILHHSNT